MYNRILGDLPTVGQLGDDQPFQFLPPIVGCSVGFNNTRCRYNPREIHVTQLLPIFPIIVVASRRGIAIRVKIAEDDSLNPNLGFFPSFGSGRGRHVQANRTVMCNPQYPGISYSSIFSAGNSRTKRNQPPDGLITIVDKFSLISSFGQIGRLQYLREMATMHMPFAYAYFKLIAPPTHNRERAPLTLHWRARDSGNLCVRLGHKCVSQVPFHRKPDLGQ